MQSIDEPNDVSLFPFLAVLLCTMGALVVLLVVMARQARLQAAQSPLPHEVAANEAQAAAAEALTRQVDQLQASRDEATHALDNSRLVLSHLEDHIRRLGGKLNQLKAAAAELARQDQSNDEVRQRTQAEIERLREMIAEASGQLDAARLEAQRKRRSYAIVPFEGQNETTRRPIYIECLAEKVILRPEGIELTSRDFQKPLGPGNALAAALRASGEYLAGRRPEQGAPASEPYPLVLIRPGGIMAYYRVREAIESWGSDFGYELIGDDWPLEFPPPDPQLAQIQFEAVELARQRRKVLELAAPSRFANQTPAFSTDELTESRSSSAGGSGMGDLGVGGGRLGGNPHGSDGGRSSDGLAAVTSGQPGRPSAGQANRPGDPTGSPAGTAGTTGRQVDTADGPHGTSGRQQGTAGDPQGTLGGRQGTAGGQAGGQGGGPGGQAGATHTLTKSRGANWAVPRAHRSAIPISRPVRLVCRHDRLILLTDDDESWGEGGAKEIPLPGPTADAVESLVSALWEHMETWGIAGNGFYWNPVLVLRVGPQGQARADELRSLLEGSGIEIR